MNDLNPKVYYMIHYYRGKVKKLCLGADFKLSHIGLQFHTKKKKKNHYIHVLNRLYLLASCVSLIDVILINFVQN